MALTNVSQQDFKDELIRAIANFLISKLPIPIMIGGTTQMINSVDEWRRIVSTGQLTNVPGATVTENQQIVLYRQDYQSLNTPFDIFIDEIVRGYCNGLVVLNEDENGHVCSVDDPTTTNGLYSIDGDFYSALLIDEGSVTLYFFGHGVGLPGQDLNYSSRQIVLDENALLMLTQFIPFGNKQFDISPDLAEQILDTNIFELMPQQSTKQLLIDKFFTDYSNLIPPDPPEYNDEFPLLDDIQQDAYESQYSVDENPETGYIPRLDKLAGDGPNDTQNLQWLRDNLNNYLKDVDAENKFLDDDERPEYEDKSEGYLKIRHMNQAIIVRKEEGDEVNTGLTKSVTTPLGEGPSYLYEGFTITMWVKFLDKVNSGTLFNFGNPLRQNNPMGFMLETFVVNATDGTFHNRPSSAFTEGDTERFIRLVVRDENGLIRDSHVGDTDGRYRMITTGAPGNEQYPQLPLNTGGLPVLEWDNNIYGYAFNYTRVPIDLTEWYFIVANYNPFINEDGSDFSGNNKDNPDYWRWNYGGTGYVPFSGTGAKCKVEIISKSDLIRARGFKLES